jgi:hypothetical protein
LTSKAIFVAIDAEFSGPTAAAFSAKIGDLEERYKTPLCLSQSAYTRISSSVEEWIQQRITI